MNRMILFRGKRVDNGEWVEGFYYHQIVRDGFNPLRQIIFEKDFIRLVEPIDLFESFEVLPETIGQFTGLTDKNGTKVFEGDLCYIIGKPYAVEHSVVVSWGKKSNGWSLKCQINDKWVKLKYYGLPSSDKIEIVGNVHELLK